MRLLTWNEHTQLSLTRDLRDDEIPPYAILSHTWATDVDEVTFVDLHETSSQYQQKPGFAKIRFCGEQARKDKIEHFWVDTCCIDKRNHVELSKAITCMFRWYQKAERCYVYLSDVSRRPSVSEENTRKALESAFRKSRWFTRGWTLQELLAPRFVQFFSKDEEFLGDRLTLLRQIHEITTIPIAALSNPDLASFPIDERIRWLTGRQTKEKEDTAYCLLGIFDVYIPLIYGEGENAWRRLRREIQDRYGRDIGVLPGQQGHLPYQSMKPLGLCMGSAPSIGSSDFIGRTTEIAEIYNVFRPRELTTKQRTVVLGGFGGVGKTQLAIAYAQQHHQYYPSVLWLDATSEALLRGSFRSVVQGIMIAQDLADLNDEQVIARALEWLSDRTNTRWLLVYDNYDDPDDFSIKPYIPNVGHGSIIITTRLPELVNGPSIRVRPLANIDDSLAILQTRSMRPDVGTDTGARQLAMRLDGLPIALVTVGAFLRKSTISFQQYLDIYERDWKICSRRQGRNHGDRERTLYTTWNLSYQRLQNEDTEAAQMLRLLAYFHNQDVQFELLRKGFSEELPEWLQSALRNQTYFESIMATLVEYCLLEVQHAQQSFGMHNCIHDWTLGELNASISPELYWYAFDCVAKSVDLDDEESLMGHMKYNRVSQHGARLSHPLFEKCNKLQTGVFGRESDCSLMGRLMEAHRYFASAELMYLRSLNGYEKKCGPDDFETLRMVNALTILYQNQGKLDQAESLCQRALAGFVKTLGPTDTWTQIALISLATIYLDQNKFYEAELTLLRVLDESKPTSPVRFDATTHLGQLYDKQDKLDQAQKMYERAFTEYDPTIEGELPWTLYSTNNLGVIYYRLGKLEQAERCHLRALTSRERIFGPSHGDTTHSAKNLYRVYVALGRIEEAEELKSHYKFGDV